MHSDESEEEEWSRDKGNRVEGVNMYVRCIILISYNHVYNHYLLTYLCVALDRYMTQAKARRNLCSNRNASTVSLRHLQIRFR